MKIYKYKDYYWFCYYYYDSNNNWMIWHGLWYSPYYGNKGIGYSYHNEQKGFSLKK